MQDKHKNFLKLSRNFKLKYSLTVKQAPVNKIESKSSIQHEFSVKNKNSLLRLISLAKINEIAKADLYNVVVFNKKDEYINLFKNMADILITYWAHEELNKRVSLKQMKKELNKVHDEYTEQVKNKDKDVLSSIKKYIILDRYDITPQLSKTSPLIEKIINLTKKYGIKEPSVYQMIKYFNSFNFTVKAYMNSNLTITLNEEKQDLSA